MAPGRALGLVVLAGAALRFATLDLQSLWYDEAVTAHLLRLDLGAMLRAIPDSESTPPLYYVLAWLWAQIAGTGEAGLRALPALLGVATIPVVWALARRLGGDRAALCAAALTAVNPMLVWFSQEARAYALLALLAAASALLWLRALQAPRRGRLLAWGAVAALALATHYYALFLVGPQALWIALRTPGRGARVAALALPAAAAIALAPLALQQRSNDSAAFIGESSLAHRLAQIPKQFLVGYDAPVERLLAVASLAVLLVAVAGLLALLAGRARVTAGARTDAVRLTAVTAAALLVPAALALAARTTS
jgi:4-amino-4-deoxy-L-arabinose transferase-like glycosyltransferase